LQRTASGLSAFRRFLPPEIVRVVSTSGIGAELGGERRTLTILFMDLRGFTSMTEEMGHHLLPYLADYMSDMSSRIVACRGTIDRAIGAATLAFWGAPAHNENHASDACRAALHCMRLLAMRRAESVGLGRPEFHARIGVNSGRVIVGNIGSKEKLDYTVLGDP